MNPILFLATSLSRSSAIKKLASKYPNLYKLILDRVTLNQFSGLPLTLLLTCIVVNLLLLNEIVESVENSPLMLSIDKCVAEFMFNIRINSLADAFFYFTQLGSLQSVVAITAVAVVFILFKKKFIYLISLLIALSGTSSTILIGKNYFHRIRPADFSFYKETLYSFPSGHATVAVAFYGLLGYLAFRHAKKYRNKFLWMVGTLLFIFLLGFSRLYLGVHYLSDVAAGYLFGLFWLLFAISIIEWKSYEKVERKRETDKLP